MPTDPPLRSRRSALRRLARTAGITPFVAAWQPLAQAQSLPPTPSCGASESPTASQTEGPFYKRSTPQRNSLIEPGMPGTRLMLSGYVMTTRCRPLPDTVLDFWQADATGAHAAAVEAALRRRPAALGPAGQRLVGHALVRENLR